MRTNVKRLIHHYRTFYRWHHHLILKRSFVHHVDNAIHDIVKELIKGFIVFEKAANVCICISVDIIPVDVAVLVKVLVQLKSRVDRAFKDAVNHV